MNFQEPTPDALITRPYNGESCICNDSACACSHCRGTLRLKEQDNYPDFCEGRFNITIEEIACDCEFGGNHETI